MADIFTCLADGTRRHLLELLLARAQADEFVGEVSVGELVEALGLSQPTVSKHLKVLRDHGLVAVREEGQHRYYRIDPAPLEELDAWLTPFLARDAQQYSSSSDASAESTVFAAWAGTGVAGRVGRAAADTAHSARAALDAAQDRLHGAQARLERVQHKVTEILPFRGSKD
tara:strand:+ start:7147 stop:7659 length:513 start_codon:yes stop_codon:yes gene_type:complete